jgi:AsmA protein
VSAATGLKRLGLAVATVFAGGFGALLIVSLLIPADTVRDRVKEQIRAVTGLDPVLSGEVAVSLFPTGRVRFDDVSLGDKRTGASALSAEQLVVRLRFFPMLAGQIEIADVTLVRPTITIGFAQDGSSNWSTHIDTLARALQPSQERVKSFSEIRISDGTVMLHDHSHQVAETLTNVDFALAWPSISKTFAATGRFVWHDEPIDATLSLTDFVAALTGDRSGLKLRLSGAPLKFAFDGHVSHRPTLKVEGTLAADTASLRDTLRWASRWTAPAGGFGRFTLKSQANIVGGKVALSNVNVELDGNVGEGVLTFTVDGRRTLQGTLATEAIDLTPYGSTLRPVAGNDWSRQPLPLADFGGVDVDLRLSAARVTIGATKLGRTAVAANLRGGDVTVVIGESQAFGGVASGTFGLAQAGRGRVLSAQLKFSDVDLPQVLGEFIDVRRVEGKGTLLLNVEGTGGSAYEIAEGLNGTASLASQKGAITGVNLEQLLRRLERNPLAGRLDFRSGKTPFDTLTVNLRVTQGVARLEDMRVDGPSVRLELAGSASVPARDLDLKGTASLVVARDGGTSFELPFVVTGPWDNPLIWPDAQALISRSGAAAPLLDAVRSRLRRTPTPEAAPSPPSEPAEPASTPRTHTD